MNNVAKVIGGVIAVGGGLFALQAFGMLNYSFFGKWGEQVRTEIQRESFAYQEGMQKNLMHMKIDYNSANEAGKKAILSSVRSMYSSENTNEYPDHLKTFLREAGIY